MCKYCFDILQFAIGNRESITKELSHSDWLGFFEFCKKQALLGIGFTAVEKLHAKGVTCPLELRMKWMTMVFQIERQNTKLNNQCGKITCKFLHDGFSTCILKGQGNLLNYPEDLKMRRTPGDIDVWATPIDDDLFIKDKGIAIAVQTGKEKVEYIEYHGHKAVIEYVKMQHRLVGNQEKPDMRILHIEAPQIDGTPIEVHFRPAFTRSPLRFRRMDRWFKNHADECMQNNTNMGFSVPTTSINVVYQLTHLFTHYLDEGLGLRQLLDYYYALKVWHNDVMECKDLQSQGMWSEGLGTPVMSKEEVMAVLRSFGMKKFASAVMYVLHKVFENEECRMKNEECSEADDMGEQQLFTHCKFKEEFIKLMQVSSIGQQLKEKCVCEPWMICEPNEREGRKLLEEIMKGGNFGQYDERGKEFKNGGMMKHGLWKLKRVMRLVRSYPEEAMWEPMFRVYHLIWRLIH